MQTFQDFRGASLSCQLPYNCPNPWAIVPHVVLLKKRLGKGGKKVLPASVYWWLNGERAEVCLQKMRDLSLELCKGGRIWSCSTQIKCGIAKTGPIRRKRRWLLCRLVVRAGFGISLYQYKYLIHKWFLSIFLLCKHFLYHLTLK